MINKLTSTPTIIAAVCLICLDCVLLAVCAWDNISYLSGNLDNLILPLNKTTLGLLLLVSLLNAYAYLKFEEEN